MKKTSLLLGLLAGWVSAVGCAQAPSPGHLADPVSADPMPFDAAAPPSDADVQFASGGAQMNGLIYEAQGPGPHPAAILLHGFPGNEKNLDLAQALRRAGWNVVVFHYRGAWGSGGQFTFAHVLEDVEAVVRSISAPELAAARRMDPGRIAVVGHSMGGFAALIAGAELPAVGCVVSLAGANLGGMAQRITALPEEQARFAGLLDAWSGPIDGPGGNAWVAELMAGAERFDTLRAAPQLAKKPVLLLAGGRDVVTPPDPNHTALVSAIESAPSQAGGASRLAHRLIPDADHSFSGQRIEITRLVTDWLTGACAASF